MNVLNASIDANARNVEDDTIGKHLRDLLTLLLEEGERFNAKRPFGNSGWRRDIIDAARPKVAPDASDAHVISYLNNVIPDLFEAPNRSGTHRLGVNVVVPRGTYRAMLRDQLELAALESCGVDNWGGYGLDGSLDHVERSVWRRMTRLGFTDEPEPADDGGETDDGA